MVRSPTMPAPVQSVIAIDAPAKDVFAVVLDVDAYPAWNPFTPRMSVRSRDLAVGVELDLDCQMTEDELLVGEREVILALDPERFRMCMGTSRKRGRPGIRSYRWQICEPIDARRTRFWNFELFEGPLAPLVSLLYREKLGRAFDGFVKALKQQVEATPKLS